MFFLWQFHFLFVKINLKHLQIHFCQNPLPSLNHLNQLFRLEMIVNILQLVMIDLLIHWHWQELKTWQMDLILEGYFYHGVTVLNRSNNSVFLYLKIYWNRQVFCLIRSSGIWMKPKMLRHQASSSKFYILFLKVLIWV